MLWTLSVFSELYFSLCYVRATCQKCMSLMFSDAKGVKACFRFIVTNGVNGAPAVHDNVTLLHGPVDL